MTYVMPTMLALFGAFFVAVNFCITVVDPLLARRDGLPPKYISPIPVFGALSLWISTALFAARGHGILACFAMCLSLVDTGGLHVFLWCVTRRRL